jgi:hypothetical protein
MSADNHRDSQEMRQIAREAGFTHISEMIEEVFDSPNESDRRKLADNYPQR